MQDFVRINEEMGISILLNIHHVELALEYAEAASVTPPTVDDALRTRLAAHFDAQALTELTALIGLQNLSARFNSAMDIPAQGLCRIPEKRS